MHRPPIRCAWPECGDAARVVIVFKHAAYGLPAGHRVAFCADPCLYAWAAAVAGVAVADVSFVRQAQREGL